jgi:phosphomannomutase/phosphoglucomutase
MRETGALLAGETAGHFFFAEPGFRFDDAILATVKVLNLLAGEACPISALVASLPRYHTSPDLRVVCPDDLKEGVVGELIGVYGGRRPLDTLDGVRIQFDDGWGLVRASQTQPAISMRFEGRSPQALTAIQDEVVSQVRQLLQPVGWELT